MTVRKIRCGDRVSSRVDPRHVGRVVMVFMQVVVRVRWDETGWLSDLDIDDIVISS